MSEEMLINGKKLLPIKELVGRTKYTRDYIAKLARDGQVVGAQIGRQWFIDEASLTQFAEASEMENQIRRRHLSLERKRERELNETYKNRFDIVALHPRYSRRRAVGRVLAIMVCGIVSGYGVYSLPNVVAFVASLQKAQSPLPEMVVEKAVPAAPGATVLPIASVVAERVVFADTHEVRAFGSEAEGVLLVPTTGTASTAAEVAALFSDPVAVTFTAPGVGYVEGVEASSTAVQFVSVPVEVAHGREQRNEVITP